MCFHRKGLGLTEKPGSYSGFFFVQISRRWLPTLVILMGSLFDQYRKHNPIQGGEHDLKPAVRVVSDELPPSTIPLLEVQVYDQVDITTDNEAVRNRIRQLMADEAHLRNQREKYRMEYYKMEARKAPQSEFAENYQIIKALTEKLAPIYIERKQIEKTGELRPVKRLTTDQELKIAALKQRKNRLQDEKSKLGKKIKNYLGYAKGLQNLHGWEKRHAEVELDIYAIDQELEKMLE